MALHPVIRENVHTGAIGRYVHAFDTDTRATLCGISAFADGSPGAQLSVEPEGTRITCHRCRALMEEQS